MTDSETHEFGRLHMVIDKQTGNVTRLMVENLNREGEHWLTLTEPCNPRSPIGYLRLEPVSKDSTVFAITEVRPGSGSLLSLQDASPDPEAPSPEAN